MNDIITLLGGILIVGASYVFANKQQKENERLEKKNEVLKDEIRELERTGISTDDLTSQLIEEKNKLKEEKRELLLNFSENIQKKDNENKKLQETIMFDNDLMTKKTELLEELRGDLNFAREVAIARFDEIRYLRSKIRVVRSKRLLKVVKAEKLVTGIIGEKVNNLYRDDMKGLEVLG